MGYARGYTPILKDTSMVVFYDKVYFPQSLCGNTWQDTDLSGSPRDRTEQMNIRHGHWLRDGNLEPWPMADGPKDLFRLANSMHIPFTAKGLDGNRRVSIRNCRWPPANLIGETPLAVSVLGPLPFVVFCHLIHCVDKTWQNPYICCRPIFIGRSIMIYHILASWFLTKIYR